MGQTMLNVLFNQQSTLMSAPSCTRVVDSWDSILRRRSCFTASSLAWYRLRCSATSSAVAFICAAIVTARSWCCSQHTVLQASGFMATICGLRLQLRLDSADHTKLVWYNAQGKHFVGEGCRVTLALLLIKLHRQVMQTERE